MSKRFTKLDPGHTLFLLVDIQEPFRKAIPFFNKVVKNINKLLHAGKIFNVPLIVTEQYPKGLGKTIKEINVEHAIGIIPKTQFSAYVPEVTSCIEECMPKKPKDVVLFGVETHICVMQTAMDFLDNNFKVHIVADCVCSRMNHDRDIGLSLMRQMGCFIQTNEAVIFSFLKDKNNKLFKPVQNIVKNLSEDMQFGRPSKQQKQKKKKKKKKKTKTKTKKK